MVGEPEQRLDNAAKQLEIAADQLDAQWPTLAHGLKRRAAETRNLAERVRQPAISEGKRP